MNAYWQCLRGIVLREWLRFVLQRTRFLSALVRPLLWLLLSLLLLLLLLSRPVIGVPGRFDRVPDLCRGRHQEKTYCHQQCYGENGAPCGCNAHLKVPPFNPCTSPSGALNRPMREEASSASHFTRN